jgi:hypothetical protein
MGSGEPGCENDRLVEWPISCFLFVFIRHSVFRRRHGACCRTAHDPLLPTRRDTSLSAAPRRGPRGLRAPRRRGGRRRAGSGRGRGDRHRRQGRRFPQRDRAGVRHRGDRHGGPRELVHGAQRERADGSGPRAREPSADRPGLVPQPVPGGQGGRGRQRELRRLRRDGEGGRLRGAEHPRDGAPHLLVRLRAAGGGAHGSDDPLAHPTHQLTDRADLHAHGGAAHQRRDGPSRDEFRVVPLGALGWLEPHDGPCGTAARSDGHHSA